MSTHASFRAAPRRLSIVRVAEVRTGETFPESVRRGLGSTPKTLSCQFFYDEAGSALFEKICDLPEYYLTRTEDAILREHAEAMVAGWDEAPAMIELGSGSSTKTRHLIGAALETYGELHYVPIDVSPTILEASARELVADYLPLRVTGYAGDYHAALEEIARRIQRPKCVLFLGSSLGNYEDDQAASLLAHVARSMGPEDRLLLGTDLIKDRSTLESAYDDAQGVTAAFNRNLLVRINRELGGDFALDAFRHEARFCEDRERVEMHLVSLRDQAVSIPGADLAVSFARGESIHTENSHKYPIAGLARLATRAGFVEEASWTDAHGRFRVQRWRTRPVQ